jgi:hypothetical protein
MSTPLHLPQAGSPNRHFSFDATLLLCYTATGISGAVQHIGAVSLDSHFHFNPVLYSLRPVERESD